MALHKLHILLRQAGISQRELARRAGIPESAVSAFLCGHCGLSLSRALRVLKATEKSGRRTPPRPIRFTLNDLSENKPPSRHKPSKKPKS